MYRFRNIFQYERIVFINILECRRMSQLMRKWLSGQMASPADSSEEAADRRVLVTGGVGFIGSLTAWRLLERGDSVVVLDNVNDCCSPEIK